MLFRSQAAPADRDRAVVDRVGEDGTQQPDLVPGQRARGVPPGEALEPVHERVQGPERERRPGADPRDEEGAAERPAERAAGRPTAVRPQFRNEVSIVCA